MDAFITALYGLAEHCGYAGLHDEMIRYRIVVGLRDAKLSENLQLDPDLTLEKVVTKVRQALVRGSGGSQVSNRQHETHLGVVTHKRRWSPPRSRQKSDKPLDKGRQGAKLFIVVGVGSPHHTGSNSVQLAEGAISAIKEVTSSQCADL